MSAGAVELIRSIRQQHPDLSVIMSIQPHPEGGVVTAVTVLGLPSNRYPVTREGDYGDEYMLSVHGPDQRDPKASLSVTRYHDDNVVAALQTALDYIAARSGTAQ
ncbi:hypothetical protein PBI_WALRUS_45 [Gordonia phage Walrus]|uniref:Uncharacterized protein n=1 Tax=Gordonia phage Walrus TaxID=2517927 RepID=A0A481S1Q0_9CAUD|nr:hypothetical protein KNU50_gp45 [Gordonia phage Walrus]QBG78436.1 hypothetical protein PBI_WALRUS_45 [Gordonia phage Walrus]